MPRSTLYFGLDLAWSDRYPSGVCVLDGGGRILDERLLRTDDEIVGWIGSLLADEPAVIGADIPLLVPNDFGARPCDRAVASAYGSRGAGPHPANRSLFMARFGRIRGEDLADQLGSLGFGDPFGSSPRTLLEVYPHPGLIEVFGLERRLAYKKGTVAERRRGLIELRRLLGSLEGAPAPLVGPHVAIPSTATGRELKAIEDRLDARFCAWTAAAWERGAASAFGDAATGHIVVATDQPQR